MTTMCMRQLIFLLGISICSSVTAQQSTQGVVEQQKETATALKHRWEEEMAAREGNRIIGIRNVFREGKPYVEIKLRSNGIFPVMNRGYELQIGCHRFSWGGTDDSLYIMSFWLPPREYEQLHTGDRVYLDGTFYGLLPAGPGTLPAGGSGDCSTAAGPTTRVLTPQRPDFSLQVSGEQILPVSGKADYSVTVRPMGGYKGTVTLSMVVLAREGIVREGITGTFEPPQITESGKSILHISSSKKWLQPRKIYLSIEGDDKGARITQIADTRLTIYTGPPDFSITTTEGNLSVLRGSEAHTTVTIKSINGFQAILPLRVSGLPPGIKASFGPDRVLVLEDSGESYSGDSYLTVVVGNKVPPGDYKLNITGTAQTKHGLLKRHAQIGLTVHTSDFSLSTKPKYTSDFTLSTKWNSLEIMPGSRISYPIVLTPTKNYDGSVGLDAISLPLGATATFSPDSLKSAGGPQSTDLTISTQSWTPPGTYAITVVAVNKGSSPQHDLKVMLVVDRPPPDFSLSSLTPKTSTVQPGGGTSYTVALDSISGYAGMISLGVTGLPSGTTASFSSDSLDLRVGTNPLNAPTSSLTLLTDNSTPPGSYKVTITGTGKNADKSVTHSLTFDMVVLAASATAP